MPTKPTDTVFDWGTTAANYVAPGELWDGQSRLSIVGLAGACADGEVPETPDESPTAEQSNEWKRRISAFMNKWIELGTADADLNAHIVETDATGLASIGILSLGGTAFAGSPLTVISNASGSAATITDNVGNFGLVVNANGSLSAMRGVNTGTAAGVEGLGSGTNNPGVKGTGTGSGKGGEFQGGASGNGIESTSGASGGFAGRFIAASSSPAVQGEGNASSSSSEGVQGIAQHDDATGVKGFTSATANAGAPAVQGVGRGDGDAGHFAAEDGYGLIAEADTTTPERAAFRIVPQDTDPNTIDSGGGDFWCLDGGTSTERWMKWSRNGDKRYLHDGLHQRMEDVLVEASSALTGVATTTTAVQSTGFTSLTGGDVILTVRAGLSISVAAGTATYLVQSANEAGFTTVLTTHETEVVDLDKSTNGLTRIEAQLLVQLKFTPTGGDVERFYRLRLTPSGGGANVKFWNPSIRLEGEFV